jgi:hypothetical protein
MGELSPWEQYKKDADKFKENLSKEVRPWDLLNPNTEYVDKEEADRRLDICKGCPFLIGITHQCKKCGCFMHLKTKMLAATCPIGQW